MAATVAGLFADHGTAHAAVERLIAEGIPAPDVSMIARDVEPAAVEREAATATAAGIATGGVLGAIGGLLVGLGAIAIPGVGPVIAAGPLAAALGGTAIGAATGGLIGALADLGVPEEYATVYATHVERGSVLLTVRTDAASEARVRALLAQIGASNLYSEKTAAV